MAAVDTARRLASTGRQAPINTRKSKALLPQNPEYYRYSGSLTTPPCSEGVTWLVMTEPLEVLRARVEKFHSLMGGDTHRPVQPLNARLPIK